MRAASILVATLLLTPPAWAFICTRAVDASGATNGPSLSWSSRLVPYVFNAKGTRQLAVNDTFTVLRSSFDVWQNLVLDPTLVCPSAVGTDLRFVETTPPTAAAWVGYNFLNPNDNQNLLVFRDDVWDNPNSAGDIIALTTTTYSAVSGEIIDADIEFNSANWAFAATNPSNDQMDLMNTAVHEIGHFLGLAHCSTDVCGGQEVMEPTSSLGETTKRHLKCDDRNGIVFKYPARLPNGFCTGNVVDATCGFCAPPRTPTQTPKVHALAQSTGRGGPSCAGGDVRMQWAWLLLAWPRLRRRWESPHTWRTVIAALALLISGCHALECDGTSPALDPNAPMIVGMRLDSQVADDPWRITLATDFVDYDGDLGAGMVNFYANFNPTPRSSPALNKLFEASGGVSLTATYGRIALPLRFPDDTQSNSTLHLGTQFVDGAGHRSNCYTMDLSFVLSAP